MRSNFLIRLFLPVLVAGLLIAVTGCSEETNAPEFESTGSEFSSDELTVVTSADLLGELQDATLENPMDFDPDLDREGFRRGGGPGGKGPGGMKPKREGGELMDIFRQLLLTQDQKEAIRPFLQESRECAKAPMQEFREANKQYIEAANEERKAIIERYHNGEITLDEAHAQLEALNEETRELIDNNPETEEARTAICECRSTLFDNIASVLQEDQLVYWNDWVAGLEGPCSDN